MLYITHIHMSGGTVHEHIISVKWRNPSDNTIGESTVATMIDWIENKKGVAKVTDGKNTVDVGVGKGTKPYLRTHADGKWTNNLLALPRY